MSPYTHTFWPLLIPATFLFLSGCISSEENSSSIEYTISTDRLNFETILGEDPSPPASGAIDIKVTKGVAYLNADYTGTAVRGVSLDVGEADPYLHIPADFGWLHVLLHPSETLGPGTYTGNVRLYACDNAECSNGIEPGTEKNISVRYDVYQFNASSQELAFSRTEGEAPPVSQSLTFDYVLPRSQNWSASISYISGSDWLTLSSPNGATLPGSLNVEVSSVPSGIYQANIIITSDTSTLEIPVTYTVESGLSVAGSTSLQIDNTSIISDLSKTLVISSNYGGNAGMAIDWQAASDSNWLSVTANGDTASSNVLTMTLNQAELEVLGYGDHTANITLSSSNQDIGNITVPVSLRNIIASVSHTAPYYTYIAENISEVTIKGDGFLNIQNPQLMFGTTPANSVTVIDDHTMVVQKPNLSSIGAYPVYIANPLGLKMTDSSFSVIDSINLGLTTTAFDPAIDNSNGGMIYDEARQSIYIVNTSISTLDRYQIQNGSWARNLRSTSIANMSSKPKKYTLSPDGKSIILTVVDSPYSDTTYIINATDLTVKHALSSDQLGFTPAIFSMNNDVLHYDSNTGSYFVYNVGGSQKTDAASYLVSLSAEKMPLFYDTNPRLVFNRYNSNVYTLTEYVNGLPSPESTWDDWGATFMLADFNQTKALEDGGDMSSFTLININNGATIGNISTWYDNASITSNGVYIAATADTLCSVAIFDTNSTPDASNLFQELTYLDLQTCLTSYFGSGTHFIAITRDNQYVIVSGDIGIGSIPIP